MSENKGGDIEIQGTPGGSFKLEASGTGNATNPVENKEEAVPAEPQDAIEYGAGADVDPMAELAAEDAGETPETQQEFADSLEEQSEPEMAPVENQDPGKPELPAGTTVDPRVDPDKVRSDPTPTEGEPKFDERETQGALENKNREGGVVRNKTTGPTMSRASKRPKLSDSGEIFKPPPDMTADSLMGKYEVTGFEVEYDTGKEMQVVSIRDYYDDLETAFAMVNGDKYFMPIGDTAKVSTVRSGAPTISYNEREIYIYKDDKWSRI